MAVSPNKVSSMENLVPEETYRKSKKAYDKLLLALVIASLVAIIMTCLFAWKISESSTSAATPSTHERNTQTADNICPEMPPSLSELPSPLPQELQEVFDKFNKSLQDLVGSNGLPAISSNAYYKDSVLWSGHYGKTSIGGVVPDNNTRYRIGSITKLFPVMMVYMLYEKGIISSIDDPLSKYCPDFVINNPFTHENITLRQIINQLSGLPREAPCVLCMRNETTAQQLMYLRNRSLVVEPDTIPSYSNLGYALLGRLLTERLMNTTFEDWTRDNILSPLGLDRTGFSLTNQDKKNTAFPYNKTGQIIPFLNIGWLAPAGQMYSTIDELTQFGMFLMGSKNNHKVNIKQSSRREILSPSNVAPDGVTVWGSPWEMFLRKNFLVRTKGGSIDGMAAMMVLVPEIKLGFNVFFSTVSNSSDGAFIANKVADRFLNSFLPVFNKTLFTLNDKAAFPVDSKPYCGTFNITYVDQYLPTENAQYYQATIKPHGVKLIYHGGMNTVSLFFIGEKLVLQGRIFGENCFIQRMGSNMAFYYKPFNLGLSPGFAVPHLGITGVRV